MKKIYLKPDSRFVDINMEGSVLNDPIANSEPLGENETRVWEENPGDRLPVSKSVWGKDETEE